MSDSQPQMPQHLLDLLSELTDGQLTGDRKEELRQLLASDAEALEVYCEWMSLHASLQLDLTSDELVTAEMLGNVGVAGLTTNHSRLDEASQDPFKNRPHRHWTTGFFVAAALAASLAAVMLFRGPTSLEEDEAARAKFLLTDNSAIAILSHVAGATSSDSTVLTPGVNLPPGRFTLATGVVQIEFLSGTNLVVEAPADIELLTSNSVYCRLGKLRARVPTQAHGFTIDTPTHRAVDMGTEFAVGVSPELGEEIHVIDGEVKLLDKQQADDERLLVLGDGVRVRADGMESTIPADSNRFIGTEQLMELTTLGSRDRFAVWKESSTTTTLDPDVISYFNFENHKPWQRELRQDSASGGASGAIIGCRWSEGRWPGKQALEFKGTEDRVRINVPGEFESISLACWVRINGFDRFLGSLMLTEGHDVGEIHWQFTDTGRLLLGVKADAKWSQDYYSGMVLDPSDVGRWIHLACVYDRETGRVSHFLNGQRVSTAAIRKNVMLRIDKAELGNWTPEIYKDHRIRALNGRMDEFVMLKRALSDEEVIELFEAGQPN
jgi:ferric-dicitrate binding protein FerR (iron transport regulator)